MYINMKPTLPSRHEARSEATRRRLCSAAIEILIEGGLGAFSFVKTCDRSGLSRGAIHHHYERPADLLADVVAEIFSRLSAGVMAELDLAEAPDDGRTIDILWSHLRSDTFRVLLEIRAAAASDPELAVAVAEPNDRINRRIIADTAARFHGRFDEPTIRVAFAALTGLALQYFTLVRQHKRRANDYAAGFIAQLKGFLIE